MKYHMGMDLICIKDVKQKRGGQTNFIKGKIYKVEDVYQKEFNSAVKPIYIQLINEQGDLQPIVGKNKTQYFKIPRPEGVPITPPPAPKPRAQKIAERKARKETDEGMNQAKEWKKVKRLRVKNKSKMIIRRVSGF